MIRILHIIDHLGSGGAQTVMRNMLKFRDTSRFEHTFATMHGHGSVAVEMESFGVKVLSFSKSKWPPGYLLAVPRELRSGRYDIVHFHLFGANWIAKPIARLLGYRILFNHEHCNDTMRHNPFFLAVDYVTNHLSTRVLAVSRSTVRFLNKKEPFLGDRLAYFANSVDMEELHVTPEKRSAARRRWGLGEDDFVIVGVGRLVPQKDFPTFFQAAAQIASRFPRARFVIFGEGPDRADLLALVERLGLKEKVSFAGYTSDRSMIYAAADMLFLTSTYEGTPLVILEAMGAGIPIAASAVDGTAEILTHDVSAILFPASHPAEAAEAAIRLVGDDSLRQRVAAEAQRLVSTEYNARKQMETLEQLYDLALQDRPS